MTISPRSPDRMELDGLTRFIHLGLMVFGLLALMTGFLAEDYKYQQHLGFSFHRWFGIGLAAFVALRLWHGFSGPRKRSFGSGSLTPGNVCCSFWRTSGLS
jgi:cytochrome b561